MPIRPAKSPFEIRGIVRSIENAKDLGDLKKYVKDIASEFELLLDDVNEMKKKIDSMSENEKDIKKIKKELNDLNSKVSVLSRKK